MVGGGGESKGPGQAACTTGRSLGVVLILLVLGSTAAAATPAPKTLSALARQGKRVVEASQCSRCHAVSDVAARRGAGRGVALAGQSTGCVSCHLWILDSRDDAKAIAVHEKNFPLWRRYLDNVQHFVALPDLGTLTRRVDPAFVRRYLDGPFDLRPHLDEAMIHVRLSPKEKQAVVAYLSELNRGTSVRRFVAAPPVAAAPSPAAVAAGRAHFVRSGCVSCHVVGGEEFVGIDAAFRAAMRPVAALAPDLRFARERMDRATLVRWIQDPRAVDPLARMPKLAVDEATAESLADYILGAKVVAPTVLASATTRPPLLARWVGYEEVRERVFGKICVHCHMDERTNPEGGPGNTGGLGYAGVRLNLESYEGIRKGLVRRGKRQSVLVPSAGGGEPLLIQALLRRYGEHDAALRGEPSTDHAQPGMPMGLPPLTDEELSLVRTWVAQGAPGPVKVRPGPGELARLGR